MRPHHLHGADRLLLGLMLDERAVLGDIPNLRRRSDATCEQASQADRAMKRALDGPAPVDEAPVPAEVVRQSVEVDVAHIRPPGLQARRTRHERAHAVVDQLAKRVDHSGVGGLRHQPSTSGASSAALRPRLTDSEPRWIKERGKLYGSRKAQL